MSLEMISKLIYILPFVCTAFVFLFIVSLRNSAKYHEISKKSYKQIERMNRKSKILNYDSIENFILSKGLKFHFGSWMNPTTFCFVEGICIIAFSVMGSFALGIPGTIAGFIVGAVFLPLFSMSINSSDEKKMTPEIAIIYNSLRIQMHSGVHVQEAISVCYKFLDEGRLRTALYNLSEEISLSGELSKPLDNFKRNFSYEPIYTLCMILEQGQRSGQMESLLGDITKQIENMQSFVLSQKKGSLDRISTFCIIAILGSSLGLILWQFVGVLMTNVTQI